MDGLAIGSEDAPSRTAAEALSRGMDRYFTGEPCKRGHLNPGDMCRMPPLGRAHLRGSGESSRNPAAGGNNSALRGIVPPRVPQVRPRIAICEFPLRDMPATEARTSTQRLCLVR
jgi:hypothetical protein